MCLLCEEWATKLIYIPSAMQNVTVGSQQQGTSQVGFYGSGITLDKARAAVEVMQEQKQQAEGKANAPISDLPFGRDSKRIFESAAEVRLKCSSAT